MSVLVIGIGNPDRGDDGAGILVIERLRELGVEGVRLAGIRGDVLDLLDCWDGAETVFLVDAMRSGAEPGTVRSLDASSRAVRDELGSFASSHAFDLAETVELARTLGRLPGRLIVYGIEALDFTAGEGPSEPVVRALDVVVREIVEECRRAGPR